MAKVNVNGTWKDVASIQVKVNGVWENVSTAYQKMSGSWQEIYTAVLASGIYYHGTATNLSVARRNLAGASVGDYAIFAGGDAGSSAYKKTVDAYSSSLVRTIPTSLSVGRSSPTGASVGNYAIFAGGFTIDTTTTFWIYYNTVNAYSSSLVRTIPTSLSEGRSSLGGASVGNYAIFAGGTNTSGGGNSVRLNTVDAYSSSLVRSGVATLIVGRGNLSGASVGNYAIFAGGFTTASGYVNTVDAYSSSLVRSTPTVLSVAMGSLGGASVGNYAIFAGGYINGGGGTDAVNAYSSSLVRRTPTVLSAKMTSTAVASVGDYALFTGGNTVNAYSSSLVRTIPTSLSEGRSSLGGASVGNYAIFAGGTGYSNTVDVYKYIQ